MERVRPIEVQAICLICRKRYPVGTPRCSCGGRLYVTGIYRSALKIGGAAREQSGSAPAGPPAGWISQEIIHKVQQQLNDGRVEATTVCMALGLHQEFGFDRDDCLRALRAVDTLMELWIRGEYSLEDMQRQVREEIGIEIRC